MEVNFKNLRVPADYPTYPPYHKGDYLEEYFYKFYKNHKDTFDKTGYTYIPVYWTSVYITSKNKELLQPYLNWLPKDKKYFTVSQHDDAVQEILPPGTLSFEAGGNKNGIPLPLICSPIEKNLIKEVNKDIFCSFVGTISHNASARVKLYKTYYDDDSFYFNEPRLWSDKVQQDHLKEFIYTTQRSIFSLCPRGYGKQSFRFYEVLQLGSIPVFVYNPEFFPFKKYIDWSEFAVCIHENDIPNLKSKLESYSEKDIKNMLKRGKEVYQEYFTMEGMSKTILRYLQDEE